MLRCECVIASFLEYLFILSSCDEDKIIISAVFVLTSTSLVSRLLDLENNKSIRKRLRWPIKYNYYLLVYSYLSKNYYIFKIV